RSWCRCGPTQAAASVSQQNRSYASALSGSERSSPSLRATSPIDRSMMTVEIGVLPATRRDQSHHPRPPTPPPMHQGEAKTKTAGFLPIDKVQTLPGWDDYLDKSIKLEP